MPSVFCVLYSEPLSPSADEYDLVTLVGACGVNHVPSAGFEQLARIVKPGEVSLKMVDSLSFTKVICKNEPHLAVTRSDTCLRKERKEERNEEKGATMQMSEQEMSVKM